MLHAVATICEKRLVSYSHYWNGTLWPKSVWENWNLVATTGMGTL